MPTKPPRSSIKSALPTAQSALDREILKQITNPSLKVKSEYWEKHSAIQCDCSHFTEGLKDVEVDVCQKVAQLMIQAKKIPNEEQINLVIANPTHPSNGITPVEMFLEFFPEAFSQDQLKRIVSLSKNPNTKCYDPSEEIEKALKLVHSLDKETLELLMEWPHSTQMILLEHEHIELNHDLISKAIQERSIDLVDPPERGLFVWQFLEKAINHPQYTPKESEFSKLMTTIENRSKESKPEHRSFFRQWLFSNLCKKTNDKKIKIEQQELLGQIENQAKPTQLNKKIVAL